MARSGLSFELRNLIHKAKKDNTTVKKEGIPFGEKDHAARINLEVIPLPDTLEPHYLVLFHPVVEAKKKSSTTKASGKVKRTKEDSKDLQITQLREELAQLREDMRSITEEQEASNEELQSSNEELLSSSEELQSLNEELETSKEELQSSLEELTIINQEISGLNQLLTNAKNYAEAIVSTVAHPILILDAGLRVKSANRSFYNYFHTHESVTEGSVIFDLGNRQWNIPSLRNLLEELLPLKKTFYGFEVTNEFPSIGIRTLLLNARELGTQSSDERLILLAFDDITEQKDINLNLERAVEMRTTELSEANKLLAKTNMELKKANTELESFSYIASHDLQEPLRKIHVFTNHILETDADKLSENGADFFKRILSSVKRMQALINDLLSFSRITW